MIELVYTILCVILYLFARYCHVEDALFIIREDIKRNNKIIDKNIEDNDKIKSLLKSVGERLEEIVEYMNTIDATLPELKSELEELAEKVCMVHPSVVFKEKALPISENNIEEKRDLESVLPGINIQTILLKIRKYNSYNDFMTLLTDEEESFLKLYLLELIKNKSINDTHAIMISNNLPFIIVNMLYIIKFPYNPKYIFVKTINHIITDIYTIKKPVISDFNNPRI